MRTTLILDDSLAQQAKLVAAERKTTLSEVVNHALRESFGRPAEPASPFSMITYGPAGKGVDHEPSDMVKALEDEDRAGLR